MTDFNTLYKLWFSPLKGASHAERLENFYASQIDSYDNFRKYLLWARPILLKACALRMKDNHNNVWVDLGGGTGENIEMMQEYIDLSKFKKIYIVDLCHSMCEKAKERILKNNWSNVEVVEGDASLFMPVEKVNLVTFSYSLSMIPPFYKVIDQVKKYLSNDGIIGVCDFGVNTKFKMSWFRRFFWRAIFDIDNIDIGPERREYLKHKFNTIWECEGEGSIPYVPYFKAPYYVWLGTVNKQNEIDVEYKNHGVEINHPSFLYHISWEDPKEDEKYMDWNETDTVLTLTGGGCNIFELLLHNVKQVVTVDINKAQTALVELKMVAFKYLNYEDVWKLFGEGYHDNIHKLYHNYLKYYLSDASQQFWNTRLYYFEKGLYNQGGMGKISQYIRYLLRISNIKLLNKKDLSEQVLYWNQQYLVKLYKSKSYLTKYFSKILENEWLCWFGLGVPKNQLNLIKTPMYDYLFDTLDPLMTNYYLTDNYFYYNIFAGKFTKETCPDYLKEENFEIIKERVNRIKLVNNTLLNELEQNKYSKVILMDHLDWMNETYVEELAKSLNKNVKEGGLVQWRSAAVKPYYESILVNNKDFILYHSENRNDVMPKPMDKVNMYAYYGIISKITV